ncbi:MAG: helix-turn-helix domain-containing protein [Lachnospiraceae bacterium]|nr:helix-turn-helix domain-containing protein [Lachnospiraceae bacterium]
MYTVNTNKMEQIMRKRHWCAADIAALTSLDHKTVRSVMKGKHYKIALNTAVKLANVLEIPIQDFIIEV